MTRQTRQTLADTCYEIVKERILDGEFNRNGIPGVDELAATCGVSRQPVLTAIKRLEFEGFLEVVPQVGSRLKEYTPREISHFFELFAEGEAIIAREAARNASSLDCGILQVINDEIHKLAQGELAGDVALTYRRLNRRFHLRIRDMSNSQVVASVIENLGDLSDYVIVTRSNKFRDRILMAAAEHDALLGFIQSGDAESAADCARRHILAFSISE